MKIILVVFTFLLFSTNSVSASFQKVNSSLLSGIKNVKTEKLLDFVEKRIPKIGKVREVRFCGQDGVMLKIEQTNNKSLLYCFLLQGCASIEQPVECFEQQKNDLVIMRKVFVDKHINLHCDLLEADSEAERFYLQELILDNLLAYYVFLKENKMPADPVYITSFFETAQEMETDCYGNLVVHRYDLAQSHYFGRMQEDLIHAYEDCVTTKMEDPENAGHYYYSCRFEQALDAFADGMQPEACIYFNDLKEQMRQQ